MLTFSVRRYAAEIKDVVKGRARETYVVLFIEYGNSETVDEFSIRKVFRAKSKHGLDASLTLKSAVKIGDTADAQNEKLDAERRQKLEKEPRSKVKTAREIKREAKRKAKAEADAKAKRNREQFNMKKHQDANANALPLYLQARDACRRNPSKFNMATDIFLEGVQLMAPDSTELLSCADVPTCCSPQHQHL